MMLRVITTSLGFAIPSRKMVMVTLVSLGPRSCLTASVMVMSFVDLPSILRIWSPALIPAW